MQPFSKMKEGIHQLNLLTEQSRRKYNMFVAWPLQDYDSEVILNRISSNKFNYWERPTPPCFLIDKPPRISPKQQVKFDELWIDYQGQRQVVFNSEEVDGLIYAEGLKAYYNQQHQYGKIFSHEIVQRIRLETKHRAIGLCLWDSKQLHGCTRTEAIENITSKYFELYDYDTAHFDRCLRTATAAIHRAEYLKTTNNTKKKWSTSQKAHPQKPEKVIAGGPSR